MFELQKCEIEGCYLIRLKEFVDARGTFVKVFHQEMFATLGLNQEFKEQYYSISHKNVLRGMHFQLPPHAHEKLVYCLSGQVLDVILDLRKESKTFGQCASFHLSAENREALYLPKGIAHGFLSLEDNSTLIYNVATTYNAQSDCGVLWSSLPFEWPVLNPILSDRDANFLSMSQFDSPF